MHLDGTRLAEPVLIPTEQAVVPQAEGNGLWDTLTDRAADLRGADIVMLFVRNPYTCDSAEGLAVRVGREAAEVAPVLDELVNASFLRSIALNGIVVYTLTEEPLSRQVLQLYATWLQEGYHWARLVMGS